MDNLPFVHHSHHAHLLSQSHITPLTQQHLLQRAASIPATPSFQDVWLKLQHLSSRYNDLLRQSRDLATNNQALANEHIRLQKELLAVRNKNEELSADAVNYRIEAWRANVRLEELSNEVQLLKHHKSQLLSLTKRSFEQIDNDGESAWSASPSSPISTAPSASTFATPSTTTPTNSATTAESLAVANPTPTSFFHLLPLHQATATEEAQLEVTSGIRNSKRRKVVQNSITDCKSAAVNTDPRFLYSAASPMDMTQEQGTNPEWTGAKSHPTATQHRRTAARTRTRTPSATAEGPSMRTRSRAKQVIKQEPMELTKPTADAVAAAVSDTAASSLGLPLYQHQSP